MSRAARADVLECACGVGGCSDVWDEEGSTVFLSVVGRGGYRRLVDGGVSAVGVG